MRYSTFQDIWKFPDQIRADLGTPLIQGLLDAISKLLAVCGRALLPQATPVQQVARLQVQGAGPRQQRPGRAGVGAHGSGRRRAGGREGGRAAPGPRAGRRPESRARGRPPHAAGPQPALGAEEAGRRRSGGPGRTRWRRRRRRRLLGGGEYRLRRPWRLRHQRQAVAAAPGAARRASSSRVWKGTLGVTVSPGNFAAEPRPPGPRGPA